MRDGLGMICRFYFSSLLEHLIFFFFFEFSVYELKMLLFIKLIKLF